MKLTAVLLSTFSLNDTCGKEEESISGKARSVGRSLGGKRSPEDGRCPILSAEAAFCLSSAAYVSLKKIQKRFCSRNFCFKKFIFRRVLKCLDCFR